MTTGAQAEVPHMIFVTLPANGRHYELWCSPEVKPGSHLYGQQDGVEIARKPVSSGRAGGSSSNAAWRSIASEKNVYHLGNSRVGGVQRFGCGDL